jgi:hypothetical protein
LSTSPRGIAPDGASTPCLIVNPRSFRAARGLAGQADALAREHGADVIAVDDSEALTAAIDAILARRQQRVMVLAGDGTVRAVVDQLAALPAGAWIPDLLVLPGGRTNLTANDLAGSGGALPALRRALVAADARRWDVGVIERRTLCIEQAPAPPRYGFWVGAAMIDGVIRRTHEHRARGAGVSSAGPLSTVTSLLRLGTLALRGRSDIRAPMLDIDAGPAGCLHDRVRLLVATTLHHRRGLFDPYASRSSDDLRLTVASNRATHFWRRLPRLLTGHFSAGMTPAHGFLSGSCEVVRIVGLDGYSLDGEAYDTDPGRSVVIRSGPRLRFFIP